MYESLEAIRQSLIQSPQILRDFVSSIPAKEMERIRRPGFWTIQEHVFHLADVQPMMYRRLLKFRDQDAPSFVPFLPTGEAAVVPETTVASTEEALSAFQAWRERTVELTRKVPGSYWEKRGFHPEYFAYTAFGLLRHLLMHDHWHMYRIEELWLTRDEYLTEVQ